MNIVLCVEQLSQKHLSSSAQWVSRQLRESLFVIGGFSANQPFAPNSCPANCDNNTENALSAGFALKPARHAIFRLFPQSKGHESRKVSEFSRSTLRWDAESKGIYRNVSFFLFDVVTLFCPPQIKKWKPPPITSFAAPHTFSCSRLTPPDSPFLSRRGRSIAKIPQNTNESTQKPSLCFQRGFCKIAG